MGWLISFLVAVLVVSVVALAAPTIFGPVVAGVAPILVIVAIIGLGGVWWRHSRHPVEAEAPQEQSGEPADDVAAEDDRVET